ncbi:hypothetical protein GCK72_013925 [Caenorhabditis remanei]|uniref:Serpentine receptor class gamma n=1 Tax=Caenorhabditis remanei TaxID=31234 RepID=A0A6A5GSL0_CAERE|nr:hypothetical protein GCK72_013925 [Caenorhabditis remanei]KAF1757469.1 hypothetical protein GCK72_013925 [Caenorhabditis remanei]
MTEVTKNFPSEYYTVEAYVFNNFFVMVFIGFCYLIICSYLLKKSWKIQMKQTSALVKRVTYQCLTVCTCHFIGCFLYVYIQYFWVPEFLSVVCHLAWIGNHSLPPYVYIIFNPSIRSDIQKLFIKSSSGKKTEEGSLRTFQIVKSIS